MQFTTLYELYWERHAKVRLKSPQNIYYFWKCHGPRWSNFDIELTRPHEVQDWFDVLAVRSKSAAVRAVNTLSAIVSWGIRRGLIHCANPCRNVDKFKLKPRRRFLLPEEIPRFKSALAKEPQDYQDIFWLCLLTGARRGNVLAMEWEEIATDLQIWVVPASKHKNDESHMVALTIPALAILERRRLTALPNAKYVFPADSVTGHRIDVRKSFARILKRAGIKNLRIHDLRRTHGSYLAMNGESQYIIGKALGHIDPRSTAIYAQLNMAPVRDAVNRAQDNYL